MSINFKPALGKITLPGSGKDAPAKVEVVVVPLPKGHVGVVFGQHLYPSEYAQRFNSYLVDKDNIVQPDKYQAVWDGPQTKSRILITKIVPERLIGEPAVLSYGPYNEDYKIAIYCSHKPPQSDFKPSDLHFDHHAFVVGKTTAIATTMINAEDGGDKDYLDAIVGVAVSTLSK